MSQTESSNGGGRRKIRYGVVGAGHIAQVAILPAFEHAENAELVALFSGDPEKRRVLGERYGIEHALDYDGYDDALSNGLVDAVYIALPNHLHCDYTLRAARRGVHVLCEKPMAIDERECERMIRACEEFHVELMIAYRLHFERANLEAIEIAGSDELGDVRLFESLFSQDVQDGGIRLNPIAVGGGTVYDMGVYCINAARCLFRDEPTEVLATSVSSPRDVYLQLRCASQLPLQPDRNQGPPDHGSRVRVRHGAPLPRRQRAWYEGGTVRKARSVRSGAGLFLGLHPRGATAGARRPHWDGRCTHHPVHSPIGGRRAPDTAAPGATAAAPRSLAGDHASGDREA
jgi:hypothetical protein